MNKSQTEKNNYAAALVGMLLIAAVILITFLRPYLSKDRDGANGGNDASSSSSKAKQISAADLRSRISSNQPVSIIDVRDPANFQAEHVADSKNIPTADVPGSLGALDKRQFYVLIDDGLGQDAMNLASSVFAEKGYENVYYLAGGFFAWKNQVNSTVSDGNPESFTDQSKVTYVGSEDLKKSMDNKENLFIIDVRKEQSFNEGHIEGATNIYLEDLEKRRKEIPMGKKVVLYDKDGLWAFKGAVRLFDMGVFNVFSVSDGFDGWNQKGYEIEK